MMCEWQWQWQYWPRYDSLGVGQCIYGNLAERGGCGGHAAVGGSGWVAVAVPLERA
jgi:hypothetical protein